MLNSTNSFSHQNQVPITTRAATIEGLMQAITSCDLPALEAYIGQFNNEPDQLVRVVERLARLVHSPELRITVRKFSWKQSGITRWGVVCEFNLVRAQRILLVPSEKEFPSVVLHCAPAAAGVVSTDCPKLMLRQVGKLAILPRHVGLPPLAFNSSLAS